MSHTVSIKSEVRDATAVKAACDRLKLPAPIQGKTKLFSSEVEGLAVNLPDWVYPVVADLPTGKLAYDNFGGRWGDQKQLDRLPMQECQFRPSLPAFSVPISDPKRSKSYRTESGQGSFAWSFGQSPITAKFMGYGGSHAELWAFLAQLLSIFWQVI